MTSLLFAMIVLFSYIGWHMGYEGFSLVGHIDLPYWVAYILCKAILYINFCLVGSYIVNQYNRISFIISIIPLITSIILDNLGYSLLGTGPIPVILFLVIAMVIQEEKMRTVVLRAIIITSVTLAYQVITILYKTSELALLEYSIYNGLMLSIDMIILLTLVWAKGGARHAGMVADGRKDAGRFQLLVFPGRIGRAGSKSSEKDRKLAEDLDQFEKWIMRSVILVVQVLQWVFILWLCHLDNLLLEGLVITTSFICYGMIIQRRRHFKPILLCTLIAGLLFYLASKFTLNVRYSQFFPILVGLTIVYSLYRIDYELDERKKRKYQRDIKRIEALNEEMIEVWDRIDKMEG